MLVALDSRVRGVSGSMPEPRATSLDAPAPDPEAQAKLRAHVRSLFDTDEEAERFIAECSAGGG